MQYKLVLPANYKKPALPGRDAWLADLRNPPANVKQGIGSLRKEIDGIFYDCCLGRLSCIQGGLKENTESGYWVDMSFENMPGLLSADNPVFQTFGVNGEMPRNVYVELMDEFGECGKYNVLSGLNDRGLSFNQIADIIEQIWDNA